MKNIILGAIFFTFILYVLYVMVMKWKERRDEQDGLTTRQKIMAYPIVVTGYVVDLFVNLTIATVVFLDPPRELTLTNRLQRYLDDSDKAGWRVHIARWLKPHINQHDPGHLE